MSYENAPATKMLATNCCCCGRPLVDSMSVELGIGPECRGGATGGISEDQRVICNRLTHSTALAAQDGNITEVRVIAAQIAGIGLHQLAEKVVSRFVNAERLAKIVIGQQGDFLVVKTPYKRSASSEFVSAWRMIPGRRFSSGKNLVPVSSKRELWNLLCRFFPGEFGRSPQGVFKIPKAA